MLATETPDQAFLDCLCSTDWAPGPSSRGLPSACLPFHPAFLHQVCIAWLCLVSVPLLAFSIVPFGSQLRRSDQQCLVDAVSQSAHL